MEAYEVAVEEEWISDNEVLLLVEGLAVGHLGKVLEEHAELLSELLGHWDRGDI
jgi:hypothetical protein